METPTSTIVKTGDLGGEKIAMTVDASAMAHIMSILTGMYSDDELACIREYSTNALDAEIAVGKCGPIHVTTPNALDPYFIVKDQGIGMSIDDIRRIYSQYGASTKRGTNEQVGMLGIGAKSALALVPTFSLISVKNGVQIHVTVSRAAGGAPEMEIIDTRATDEPNGVEVRIPIPRSREFAEKCRNFFRFWQPGTVLVDGKEPEFITGLKVSDKFLVNRDLRRDYIVMGNVAYPCKTSLYQYGYSYNQLGVVAFVDIGDVNFAPNREELHYNAHTNATIERLQKEFTAAVTVSAQADVDAADTHAEAWSRARKWNGIFYSRLTGLTYQGDVIPTEVHFDIDKANSSYRTERIAGKLVDLYADRAPRSSHHFRSATPSMVDTHLFITGFAQSLKMSPVQRERARIYIEQQGWHCESAVIFTEDKFITDPVSLKFLAGLKVVPWEEIAKIKVERAKTARGARTEKYDMYTTDYRIVPISDLDDTKDIIFISPAENKRPSFLVEMYPDAQVIVIGQNRWEKFKRDWPTAVWYRTKIMKEKEELVGQVTYADKLWWQHGSGYRNLFSKFDPAQIDDPELKGFVEILKGDYTYSDAAIRLRKYSRHFGMVDTSVDNPLNKYPLAGRLWDIDTEHAMWYVNSYYAHLNSQED